MSDTNHHVLTGKVDITSNLLVGSSHLFVDTENNRVGLVTANPQAGLHVNSNAYVNTDLRVGPAGTNQIVINATAGRIKAASFEGDGSSLQNIPPGADGAAATIAVGTTTTGAAGTSASVTNSGTSSAAVFNFTIPKGDQGIQGIPGNDGADGTNYFTLSGSNIYRSTGNVGIGGTNPSVAKLHIGPFDNDHLYLASANDAYGWKLDTEDQGNGAVPFRIKKRLNGTDQTILTIKNQDGFVGVGTTAPGSILDVHGASDAAIKKSAPTASTGTYNFILNGPRPGTSDAGATHFINGSTRDEDGGSNVYTIRNDSGPLRLGNAGFTTSIQGPLHINCPSTTAGRVNIERFETLSPVTDIFTGLDAATSANGRAQLVLSSAYSDVVIASSQVNNAHGSTLSFVTYNPSNTSEYRKFVINQGNWGNRKEFLDFGLSSGVTGDTNPHMAINSGDTVLTLDGTNKRVGINTENPHAPLDVRGAATITSGDSFATKNGYMQAGSLNIGSISLNYGGGWSWNTNTAGLMLECADNTEIAVHDSGARLASLMYYVGASNQIQIGRNMGWGGIGQIYSPGEFFTDSNKSVIRGPSPTLYLRDTNHRSGMVHMNDNRMYFLSGGVDSETWAITANGRWPLYIQTDTNESVFGGNINTVGNISIHMNTWALYMDNVSDGARIYTVPSTNYGCGFKIREVDIHPIDRNGNGSDGVCDFGTLSYRWRMYTGSFANINTSDDRVKHNEEEVHNALETINKLKLYKYDKTAKMLDADYQGDLSDVDHKKEAGFIAQDILNIPELAHLVVVPEDVETTAYGLDYQGIHNYLVQAVQELHGHLQSEKEKVATMELLVASLVKRIGDLENLVI